MQRSLLPLLSTVVLVPLLAATLASNAYFTDVPSGAWFRTYIEQAVDAGIVSGYKDQNGNPTGRFGPENSVTVGEALKIVLEGAGYDTSRGIGYGHWAARYMSVAVGLGFQITQIQGLNLDRPATRAEVSSLVVDAFKLDHPAFSDAPYSDVSAVTPYAGSIQALTRVGIVTGDTDASGNSTGRFRPLASVNRAETVKIIMIARDVYGRLGSSSSFSSVSSRSSSYSSRSSGTCSVQECGTAPGMPNWQCPNGSIAGPSCERLPDGRCGWLIRQCPIASSSSSRSSSSRSSSHRAAQTYILTYTDTGFQPSFITIRDGDTVVFRNQSMTDLWVAGNPHPTHADYPELDQHGSIGNGDEFSFTFHRVGVWGFHNHLKSSAQGVVSVDPN